MWVMCEEAPGWVDTYVGSTSAMAPVGDVQVGSYVGG